MNTKPIFTDGEEVGGGVAPPLPPGHIFYLKELVQTIKFSDFSRNLSKDNLCINCAYAGLLIAIATTLTNPFCSNQFIIV